MTVESNTVFVDRRDFGKQNTRGNVSKIPVCLACYRQIKSKSTNHSLAPIFQPTRVKTKPNRILYTRDFLPRFEKVAGNC